MQTSQKEINDKLNLIIEKLEKISEQIKIEDNLEEILKKSKIVDVKQISIIKNWISPNQKINCKLLYDGRRDGNLSDNFHSQCDNKGPTITFIKTKQGRRFGGFSMQNWNKGQADYINDDKAFIFDLDKNEKYDVVLPGKAIYSIYGCGPIFGCHHDIRLKDNFFYDNESYYYHKNNSYYKYSSNIDNNKIYFTCEELEVYQILFL